jgi:hypothetical protein
MVMAFSCGQLVIQKERADFDEPLRALGVVELSAVA